jgi:hypothetical protein
VGALQLLLRTADASLLHFAGSACTMSAVAAGLIGAAQADGERRKAQLEKARAEKEDKEVKALAQGAHRSKSRPRSAAASGVRPRSALR